MPTNVTYTPISSVLGTGASVPAAPRNELDRDAFLKLLVAQLRYQDPTAPMDTSALMAQTSQLTTVEKLTEMAETSRSAFDVQQRLGAASLVGRQVTWTGLDGTTTGGTVSAVSLVGPTPLLRVGDMDVALDEITAIVAAAPSTIEPSA